MANTKRGDVDIDIGGEPYTMRPSFEALCEIEAATGKGILLLASEFANGNIEVTKVAQIIYAGLGGFDKKTRPSFREVGNEVQAVGLIKMAGIVTNFLVAAISGDSEDKGEPAEKN